MFDWARGRFPIAAGSDDLLGQCADTRTNGSQAKTDRTLITLNWRSKMTLIKSILLGSAAGIVAVASAQAADLPTRKAAPVEYVRVCNVGGITGWTMPGSDTCMKVSGYITAQFEGGNLNTQYNWGSISSLSAPTGAASTLAVPGGTVPVTATSAPIAGVPAGLAALPSNIAGSTLATQRILIANSPALQNTKFYRDQFGWTMRANVGFDFASNTAYGPLIGHVDINSESGSGFENNNNTYVNTAYVTWAGITAGKAQSFFSFIGGGDNWDNFFSPDRKGFNEPNLIAYTASFGGGFTATISAESPGQNGGAGFSGQGTDFGFPNYGNIGYNQGPIGGYDPVDIRYGGQRWPDFVGALHVKQGWGEAQLSGVIHNVNVAYTNMPGNAFQCGLAGTDACDSQENKIGWGLDAGVKFNLNGWNGMFASGDDLVLTGAYTRNAYWYSGLGDAMWSENGQVNGNGQPMYAADAFFNPLTNQWSDPTAWSVSGLLEHHWTPTFYTDFEGSIGGLKWSNMGGGCSGLVATCSLASFAQGPLSPSAFTWLVGADIGWNPVTNLNFDLELMYQSVNQERPSGFLGTVYNSGVVNPNGSSAAFFVPGNWQGNSSGFEGRLRVTRYF
jgi:Porin subfamily